MSVVRPPDNVQIGPMRLRVRVTGTGPPLLLLMGIGGNLDMWEPLVKELPNREVIMFDHPGTGGSSQPWLPATISHNAWLTSRVLHQLGYGGVDVLGYSWGGLVAQHLSVQHRWAVRRLVLACTTVGWGGRLPSFNVARRMASPRRYYSRDHFRAIAPKLFGGDMRTNPSLADREFGERFAHPPSRLGYFAQLTAAASYSSLPLLPLISAPTLVLAGGDDPIVPGVNARLLATGIRRGRLHVLKDAGHLLLFDRPAEAARIIDDFLNETGR